MNISHSCITIAYIKAFSTNAMQLCAVYGKDEALRLIDNEAERLKMFQPAGIC